MASTQNFIISIVTLLANFVLHAQAQYGEGGACICPAFRREICALSPSGNMLRFENLCVARCLAGMGTTRGTVWIGPRTSCYELRSRFSVGNVPTQTNVSETWLQDVTHEARIWKRANGLIAHLRRLVNGGGPKCTCPAINREACTVGASGQREVYSNVCSLICDGSHSGRPTLIGDLCYAGGTSYASFVNREFDEDKELSDWFKFIDREIQFYRKVSEAMTGFFET